MERIDFYDDETGEKITFDILSAIQYKEDGYLLVIESDTQEEEEEVLAYVLKATYLEGDDIIYEIVEDDDILDVVFPMLEKQIETFEN
ncbi:DUF1292 domain-containing protein [Vallitaleaceae bacterium 9-2]